jgi:Transglutaminase-like superfamily
MKVTAILLILCCSWSVLFSQKDPMKFGVIPMEDLTMTSYDRDSSASAIVLYEFGKVYPQQIERHVRIKILKTEGTRWADQTIQLPYSGTNGENQFQFKASTFNLVNGQVVETELPKQSMFREKLVRGIELQKFTFQNVKVGSILEFSYSMRTPGMQPWRFQKTIPTRVSELWTIVGSDNIVKHYTHGYITAATYEVQESAATHTSHWVYRDVPAFKAEPFMSSEEDYIGMIEFYQTHFGGSGVTLEIMASWEKVNEVLLESEYIGGHITGNSFLKSITKELVEGKPEAMDKVSAIYNYVKNKYTWQPRYGVGSLNLKEAFDRGIGTSSDINLTLASMLNKAGFEVNLVLITTRDNGLVRKQVVTPYQFNYLICAVTVGDRIILLDATEKQLPLGFLPERCLNGEGLMLNKVQYAWIPTNFLPISKTVASGEMTLDANGSLAGKLTITRDGYHALDFRKSYTEKGHDEYVKDFLHKMGWEADSPEVQNVEDLTKSTKEIYSIRVENQAAGSADILYINPILCERVIENPFTADERQYPISYSKTYESIYMSRIKIPEGYTVEEIPAPLVIKLRDNSAKYTYSVTHSNNVLSILSNFKIGKTLYIQNEYLQLKELYSQVVAKQAEQIVLKKIK